MRARLVDLERMFRLKWTVYTTVDRRAYVYRLKRQHWPAAWWRAQMAVNVRFGPLTWAYVPFWPRIDMMTY